MLNLNSSKILVHIDSKVSFPFATIFTGNLFLFFNIIVKMLAKDVFPTPLSPNITEC